MDTDRHQLRERLNAFARYNAWERRAMGNDPPDLAARIAWLEEAYELARSRGAMPPLPSDLDSWREAVSGVREMQRCLARLKTLHV